MRRLALAAVALVAGALLSAAGAPQSAQACLVTAPGTLSKPRDINYATVLLDRYGIQAHERLAAVLKEAAPDSTALVDIAVGRCSPPFVALHLSGMRFGGRDEAAAAASKDNFEKIWAGLQRQYADQLCAADGSSGAAPGTLLKIKSTRKLPLEVEAIAHILNGELADNGSFAVGPQARDGHPPSCGARGLETGARLVTLAGVAAA